MNLPKYRYTARSSIGLVAILGAALLTAFVEPWRSFSLPLGPAPKELFSANGVPSYSSPWRLTAASKPHLVPSVVGMLVVSLVAGFGMRRQRMSSRATAIIDRAKHDDGIDCHDDLLVKAGLKNLLGGQDNRIARQLENTCRSADDMERHINVISTKNDRTTEELLKSRESAVKLETERDAMKRELTEMTGELEEIRNTYETAVQQNAKALEDLAEFRAQVLDVKAERDTMKKDLAKVTEELADFQNSFGGAAQQSANIMKQLDASQAKALKLETDRDAMKKDIAFLKELLDKAHTMDDLMESRSKNLQLEVERDTLKKQLSEATSKIEMRSTSHGTARQSDKAIDNVAESPSKTIELEAEQDAMQKKLVEMANELTEVRNAFQRSAEQSAQEFSELQASLTKAMEEKARIAEELEKNVSKLQDTGQTTPVKNNAAEASCSGLSAQDKASGECGDAGKQLAALRIELDEEKRQNQETKARLDKELMQSETARQFLIDELFAAKASVSFLTSGMAEIQELMANEDAS